MVMDFFDGGEHKKKERERERERGSFRAIKKAGTLLDPNGGLTLAGTLPKDLVANSGTKFLESS